jgi:hypothetical protein
MGTNNLFELADEANGMKAIVFKVKDADKYRMILRDTDADMVVGIITCPTLELAIAHAKGAMK